MQKFHINRQFNWRIFLLRILINAIALLLVAVLLPDIYFKQPTLIWILFLGLVLGLLNAILKPILQLLTFSLIFASYGVVLVLINALNLLLLDLLFPDRFAVTSLLWALVGGALIGIVGSFLESVFGLSPPILPEKYTELREAISKGVTPAQAAFASAATGERASGVSTAGPGASPAVEESPAVTSTPGSPPDEEVESQPPSANLHPKTPPSSAETPIKNEEDTVPLPRQSRRKKSSSTSHPDVTQSASDAGSPPPDEDHPAKPEESEG